MPMRDLQFARADAALGFNWNAGFDWITTSSRPLRYILEHAYNSMMVQNIFDIFLLSFPRLSTQVQTQIASCCGLEFCRR